MAKQIKQFILIARYQFKNSNHVVYRVRSNQANKVGRIEGRDQVEQNGQWFDCYNVSCNEEYVCGCQGSGEQCPGRRYKGTCGHSQFVEKLIVVRKQQHVETVSQPDVSPKVISIQKKRREMLEALLNGNRDFRKALAI